MPSKAVMDAFEDRLGPTWNGIPVIGIGTTPYPPANQEAFISIQYPVVNADQPTLGRRFFEEGAARILLVTKRTLGVPLAQEWADGIAALFRADQLGNGVETFAPSTPIYDDTNEDGNWRIVAVIVPFRYQFNG